MTAALTYQQRNALASQPGGALATIKDVSLTPIVSAFATLEASTMGVLGTPADGFDRAFAPLTAAIPVHTAQLQAMDVNIAAATFKTGVVSAATYGPIGARITALTKVGDAQLAVLTASGIVPPAPVGGGPAPKPAPGKPVTTTTGSGGCGGNQKATFPGAHVLKACPEFDVDVLAQQKQVPLPAVTIVPKAPAKPAPPPAAKGR
jgi:hypothetical protein